MPIHTVCPCGTQFKVPDSRDGMPFRCYMCGRELVSKAARAASSHIFDARHKTTEPQSEAFSTVPFRQSPQREAITTRPGSSAPAQEITAEELFEIIHQAVGLTAPKTKKQLVLDELARKHPDEVAGSVFDKPIDVQKSPIRMYVWIAAVILMYVASRVISAGFGLDFPSVHHLIAAVALGSLYMAIYCWLRPTPAEDLKWPGEIRNADVDRQTQTST